MNRTRRARRYIIVALRRESAFDDVRIGSLRKISLFEK